MVVWLPNSEASVKAKPSPSVASTSKVATSPNQNPNLASAINDQSEPRSSSNPSEGFFHWWPKKGTTEWVEYTFEKSISVSESEIYWVDDTGHGDLAAAESEQLIGERGGTFGSMRDLADEFQGFRMEGLLLAQYFRIAQDDGEEIVEIVRDAAGKAANSLHFLGLEKLTLEVPAFLGTAGDPFLEFFVYFPDLVFGGAAFLDLARERLIHTGQLRRTGQSNQRRDHR